MGGIKSYIKKKCVRERESDGEGWSKTEKEWNGLQSIPKWNVYF